MRRPSGKLHVAITMRWLQDRAPDLDAMTDLSRLSLGPSVPSSSAMHYQVSMTRALQKRFPSSFFERGSPCWQRCNACGL